MGSKRATNIRIGHKRTSRKKKMQMEQLRNARFKGPKHQNEFQNLKMEAGQSLVEDFEQSTSTFQLSVETEPEFQVKQELQEDTIETEVEVDHFLGGSLPIIDTDPLIANANTNAPIGIPGPEPEPGPCGPLHGKRCLICFHNDPDPDPRPLKGILPKPNGLTNPSQVEDDMRIIHLLKTIFEWSTFELNYLMQLANGQSPRDWIHICKSCRILVFEIISLEDKMRECRKRIKGKIMASRESSETTMAPLSKGTMTGRIRNLVTQQVRSVNASGSELRNGDLKAKRLVDLQLKRQGPIDEDDNDVDEDGYDYNNELCPQNPLKGNRFLKRHPNFDVVFTCPYGCRDSLLGLSSAEKKMNISELFYHLIWHNDYPMNCSECKVFLPRDPTVLDSHWQQYHLDVKRRSEKRFFEKQLYIKPPPENDDNQFPTLYTINCEDCEKSVTFSHIDKFKIHQALEHPEIARMSCPFCLKRFPQTSDDRRRMALENHMKVDHILSTANARACLNSYPCRFCGESLPLDLGRTLTEEQSAFKKMEKLHMMSSHGNLISASYACTQSQCSQEFANLKDFIKHGYIIKDHRDLNLNIYAVHLFRRTTSKMYFSCGLCESTRGEFKSINSFLCHLTLKHSLYFKWKFDPLNPTIPAGIQWRSMEDHIKAMTEYSDNCKYTQKTNPKRFEKKRKMIKLDYLRTTKKFPKYSCPSCPELGKMDLDAFIVHLLFHWRHPNKCTSCEAYLPFAMEAVEDHWKYHHPTKESSSKFKTAHFSPGNIFKCLDQDCPEKFMTFRERNEHELSHGLSIKKSSSASCKICNELFLNTSEVRLHKALDHPEIACLTCYYCDDIFPAESLEGSQYLDSEALHHHILQKDDHPKFKGKHTSCHIKACDLCGEVMPSGYQADLSVLTHITEDHEIEPSKIFFSCFICNKGVKNMWKHLSSTHAKNCICAMCGEEMRPRTLPDHTLNKHDVLMEGYKIFCCKEQGCQYRTVHNELLKNHVSVNHSKQREKTHKCSVCQKTFYSSSNLRDHEERHRNEETRPYQCDICGSSYKTKNTLYIHKRLSHLNRKFPSTNRKRTRREQEPVAVTPEMTENRSSLEEPLSLA